MVQHRWDGFYPAVAHTCIGWVQDYWSDSVSVDGNGFASIDSRVNAHLMKSAGQIGIQDTQNGVASCSVTFIADANRSVGLHVWWACSLDMYDVVASSEISIHDDTADGPTTFVFMDPGYMYWYDTDEYWHSVNLIAGHQYTLKADFAVDSDRPSNSTWQDLYWDVSFSY